MPEIIINTDIMHQVYLIINITNKIWIGHGILHRIISYIKINFQHNPPYTTTCKPKIGNIPVPEIILFQIYIQHVCTIRASDSSMVSD